MISDPRTIPQADLPLIVFSDVTYGWIAFLIKWRTSGDYDHVMISITKGKFICQDFSGYHEIPMENYLKKGNRLKFFSLVNITPSAIITLNHSINDRLKLSWWKKCYDWLGIIGQALGQEWIHTPGLEYCSEDVVRKLKNISPYLPQQDQTVISNIGNQWNPEQLEIYCQSHPETFKEYGKWEADDGVIV